MISVSDSVFHSEMKSPSRPFSLTTLACLCFCLSLPVTAVAADTSSYPVDEPGTEKPRQTLLDIRFKNVVRQKLDFSCGAAALSTLLTYYFGDSTTEAELLEILESSLSADENDQRTLTGYSLLDLKNAASVKGYDAAGYRLSFEQLRQLASPVIVYVVPLGYKHFAVLRGVVGDRVWLADPSRGNLRMSVSRFMNEWGGVAFVLGKAGESDIGLHPLSISEMRDTLIDRSRLHRRLDIDDRLLVPRVALPASFLR